MVPYIRCEEEMASKKMTQMVYFAKDKSLA
jgi:hypothetical protein